jgi:hypothetical protein
VTITTRAQLGWQRGDFSHLVYVQAVAPTGRWRPGFPPTIGLHRPGIDTGWAFSREHKPSKLQLNGSAGLTFNFEDAETDYKTGNEFHFEWAIGREFATGLVIGIVGYDYRQLTGDPGAGALIGPFKGSVDAIGVGVSYTRLINKTPLVFNLRQYHDFDAENRWQGDATIASATASRRRFKGLGPAACCNRGGAALRQTSPSSARHRSRLEGRLLRISFAKGTKTGCPCGFGRVRASTPPQRLRPRGLRWRHLPLLDLTVFADANRMHQSPELASADRGCADKSRQHP